MDPEKQQLLENIFGIDMEYIDPVVWYVYNVETGVIDDFNDEIHFRVHVEHFLELGAKQIKTLEIDQQYLDIIQAKSGTITLFEVPRESQLEIVKSIDELAKFFDLETRSNTIFPAVKIIFE